MSTFRDVWVLVLSVCLWLAPIQSYAEEATSFQAVVGDTVYEQHLGLFATKPSSEAERPLFEGGEIFSRSVFSVVGGIDQLVGRTLHTKTYIEDTTISYVTLDDPDGAKVGFDF